MRLEDHWQSLRRIMNRSRRRTRAWPSLAFLVVALSAGGFSSGCDMGCAIDSCRGCYDQAETTFFGRSLRDTTMSLSDDPIELYIIGGSHPLFKSTGKNELDSWSFIASLSGLSGVPDIVSVEEIHTVHPFDIGPDDHIVVSPLRAGVQTVRVTLNSSYSEDCESLAVNIRVHVNVDPVSAK
jgi:hypothetical protein